MIVAGRRRPIVGIRLRVRRQTCAERPSGQRERYKSGFHLLVLVRTSPMRRHGGQYLCKVTYLATVIFPKFTGLLRSRTWVFRTRSLKPICRTKITAPVVSGDAKAADSPQR